MDKIHPPSNDLGKIFTGFSTLESTSAYFLDFFSKKMQTLHLQFNDKSLKVNKVKVYDKKKAASYEPYEGDLIIGTFLDDTFRPAMVAMQLVQEENRLLLFTMQAGDSMILVEMEDGQLLKTQQTSHSTGVGYDKSPIKAFDITGAKRIFGFSDGISDYLSLDEFKEIIKSTSADHQLLDQIKEKIKTTTRSESDISNLSGEPLKDSLEGDYYFSDDLGFFVMNLPQKNVVSL